MRVFLTLRSYDPGILEPLSAAVAGESDALRAWLRAVEHVPEPGVVEALRKQVEALEAVDAPSMLLEAQQRALYEARHGVLAGKNIAEANLSWLLDWSFQLHQSLEIGETWDLMHYAFDATRRAREQAVHWRFLEGEPSLVDYALFGTRPTARIRPQDVRDEVDPDPDPDPEKVVEAAEGWADLFLPYDGFDNDVATTAAIAEALRDARADPAVYDVLDRPLPDHVYLGARAAEMRAELRAQGDALVAFYGAAAQAGHHVQTSWRH